MDYLSKLRNYLSGVKQPVQQAIQQAPQQIASFGQGLLRQIPQPQLPTDWTPRISVTPKGRQAAGDFWKGFTSEPMGRVGNEATPGLSPYEQFGRITATGSEATGVAGAVKYVGKAPKATKTVEQIFKTEKFNLGKKGVQTLENMRSALGLDKRTVRTFEDMRDAAETIGTDPKRLLKDVQTGRITDSEVIALGNIISTSTQRIAKLSQQLKNRPGDLRITQRLAAEEELLNQALRKRIKGGTEAGRAVVAFRQIANRTLDKTYWLDKAKRQIGEEKELSSDVVTAINGFIKSKDRLGLANFISKLGESTGAEKAIALWKAGLLTGFRTHEANLISNTAMGVMENLKDIPATGFDIARSAITRAPRTKALTLKQVTGQVAGAGRGLKQAKEYFTKGIDPTDIAKAEIHKPIRFGDSKGGRIAQKYVDTVFRGLGAEDKVFRETAFSRSLAEQAAVQGINRKLTAGQIDELMKNPSSEMLDIAKQASEYATFTKDNVFADMVRGAKTQGGTAGRIGLEVASPFVKTPSNVFEALFDYSPAGIVKDTIKKLINNQSVDDRRLAESFGRSMTGLSVIWAGFQLAKAGKMTGASPSSEAERAQWELEGKMPNSIMVNGKWRSLDRISPVGNLLVLGYSLNKAEGDPTAAGMATAKSLTDQPFLTGVSGGLKALTEPDKSAGKFVERTLASSVPSLSSDLARGTDTVRRDPQGIKEKAMERLPGLRQQLPIKPNPLGQATPQEGGLVGNLFDPFNSRTPTNDPLVKEFSRVGYNLNYVGDRLNNEKLTPEQKRVYQMVAGQIIRQNLPAIIDSSTYKNSDIDTQKSLIEAAVNKAKDMARERMKNGGYVATTPKASPRIAMATSEEGSSSTSNIIAYEKDGKLKSLDLSKEIKMPELTGQPDLDKELVADYKGELRARINAITEAARAGKLQPDEAQKEIAKLKQSSEKAAAKTAKPKKLAIKTLKLPKSSTLGTRKTTSLKLPKYNPATFKLPELRPRKLTFKTKPLKLKK